MSLPRPSWRAGGVVLATALFLLVAANLRFWQVAFAALPGGVLAQARFVLGFGAVLLALILVVLLPLSFGRLLKPWLSLVLLLAATAAFFMHDYGAVVDRFALQSVLETDAREAGEWLSLRALGTVLLLGVGAAALAGRVVRLGRKCASRLCHACCRCDRCGHAAGPAASGSKADQN